MGEVNYSEMFGSSSAAAFSTCLSKTSAEWITRQQGNNDSFSAKRSQLIRSGLQISWRTPAGSQPDLMITIVLALIKILMQEIRERLLYKSCFQKCLYELAGRLQILFTPLIVLGELLDCACLTTRMTFGCWSMSKEGQQGWWRG